MLRKSWIMRVRGWLVFRSRKLLRFRLSEKKKVIISEEGSDGTTMESAQLS